MKVNWWKVGVFGGAIAALMYWAHSCGVRSVIAKAGRVDTVYAKADTIRVDTGKTKLVKVIKWIPHGIIVVDSIIREVQPVDSAAILEAYNSTYLYSYQERMKYGLLTVEDTISQNMFLGRGVTFVADSVPIVTKRELILQPKKIILYGTLSGMGNKKDILYGFGGGLALKGLNDKIYGVELKYLKGGSLYYEGKIMIPIRLKR